MMKMESAMFAAGCFWGVEETFRKLKGVKSTAVGYTGGLIEHPDYEMVCDGNTGHAEALQLEFDPAVISYEELLNVFWDSHNPTQLNRQGPDFGEQYRSAIFYHTPEQKELAAKSKQALEKSGKWKTSIVTQVVSASHFWKAEGYHQQYLKKRGLGNCHI